MEKQTLKKKGFERCVICQQTRTNCWHFQRVIYEMLCFELHMLLCSLLRNKSQPLLTRSQSVGLLPVLAILIQMRRQSPPVPDYLHDEHLPAHWLTKRETGGHRESTPEKVDFSLMWQLQLNCQPHCYSASSSLFLRSSALIRYSNRQKPRRLFTPVKRPRARNSITQAVLQGFPCNKPTYTPPICSITLEIPKHPGRVVPCGHTFSFQAIEQWAEQHPPGQAPCPNCRGKIEKIEQICLPLPLDHRRLHESTYLLLLSTLPEAKPIPSFRRQESEITQWLLRHSLFFSNPGAQEMIRQREARP